MGLTYLAALLGGLAFFFSPCVWPLYPAYVGCLTGLDAASVAGCRRHVTLQALAFILGFTLVFVALGATASSVGRLLSDYQDPLRKVGGLVVIAFGLSMAGLLPEWLLGAEARPQVKPGAPSWWSALAMGVAFGFGWTPCVGPVLASILVLTSTVADLAKGVSLLAVYSLGLAVPFLLLAVFLDRVHPLWRRLGPWLPAVRRASGLLMVLLGWLIFTDSFSAVSRWLFYAF
ncbi:MAG: sulfite exporter TauE/SafE family protein [Clostridia bacterium]|nr:sulfite exporter TauE/SafE family protein [Clostridia bacterium]